MIAFYVLAWFPMVLIAIANGAARDLGYGPRLGELRAHQLSTVSAAVLFTLYTWMLEGWRPLASANEALAIGAIWLVQTVVFEFGFGRCVAKHPWSKLFADYDFRRGRVWSLLLLWLFLLPYAVWKWTLLG